MPVQINNKNNSSIMVMNAKLETFGTPPLLLMTIDICKVNNSFKPLLITREGSQQTRANRKSIKRVTGQKTLSLNRTRVAKSCF